jgi:N-carbamoylputrescine amidase
MSAPGKQVELGIVQMRCEADTDRNLARAQELTREAAARGATLVCLPELFRSRYFCQTEDAALFDLAETIPGPSSRAFCALAAELDITVIISVFERRTAGLYHNTALVIDGKLGLTGTYRKMHIPDDPRFYEKFYFAPGDLGFKAFDTRHGRIGTLICWDQWYPEGARLTALRGAAVLFYPTAIGWHPAETESEGPSQRSAWQTIQRSHAIANGVYVAVVNRVGHEKPEVGDPGLEFWGSSFLADPFGVVIAEAPIDAEAIVVGEVDIARMEQIRRGWPFLRDRRIDAYSGLAQRFLV